MLSLSHKIRHLSQFHSLVVRQINDQTEERKNITYFMASVVVPIDLNFSNPRHTFPLVILTVSNVCFLCNEYQYMYYEAIVIR